MCTVSFIPSKKGITLTSNRDERSNRKITLNPDLKQIIDMKWKFR
jgi:hypothetical protein